jgi:tryptophanase
MSAPTLPPEPFKMKAIEPIRLIPAAARRDALARAGYNVFGLRSDEVYIDLLTDSGTGAMSDAGWSALLRGDEAYAGARSFDELRAAVQDVLGFPWVLPVHQGRGAETVLGAAFLRPGSVVPGNAHFDTTKAHIENRGARAVDVTVAEATHLRSTADFKGNLDVARLESVLSEHVSSVPYVLVTVTCNTVGGQPVSVGNLREVRRACDRHGVLLGLDIARFAENAWFVREREREFRGRPLQEVVRSTMEVADFVAMSGKKDALSNIGGFLATRSESLYERLRPYAILYEGYVTYGGLAGRDLAAMAVGLREVLDEAYLGHRIAQVATLAESLAAAGVPVLTPAGGHAVYIDARAFLPQVPREELPGQALVAALYEGYGIRAVEVGTVMAGRDPDTNENVFPPLELVRLAVPRRTYTNAQLAYVAASVADLFEHRGAIGGLAFEREAPVLRQFSSTFRPVTHAAHAGPSPSPRPVRSVPSPSAPMAPSPPP